MPAQRGAHVGRAQSVGPSLVRQAVLQTATLALRQQAGLVLQPAHQVCGAARLVRGSRVASWLHAAPPTARCAAATAPVCCCGVSGSRSPQGGRRAHLTIKEGSAQVKLRALFVRAAHCGCAASKVISVQTGKLGAHSHVRTFVRECHCVPNCQSACNPEDWLEMLPHAAP